MEFRRVLFRSEAYRNFPVAERLTALVDYYRSGVRQLAALTRPDVTAGELEAYVDIMMACFFGLGHRTLIGTARDVDKISHETACLLMRALGAPDQRSEEHTSELHSLMRISYAVFCLKKKYQQRHYYY